MPLTPCPYCGHPHETSDVGRCENCNGLFEPLSQMATQLAMGPWYIRDEDRPFMPGFNETILRQQVAVGRIKPDTIVRGPSTNQFWMTAAKTPGLSRLLGTCHACDAAVSQEDTACSSCQADLSLPDDVDRLGLSYTTAHERAQAQQEINEKRTTAKPTPAPKPKPTAAPSAPEVDPNLLKPVQPAPVETVQDDSAYEDDHDDHDIAEDVWHAEPAAPRRRRKKNKGADPLVMGMGVMFLCVIAIGLLILLTGGPKDGADDDSADTGPDKPIVERDAVAVSRASVPVLTAYERLKQEEVPEPFAERYAEIKKLIEAADADQKAERFNPAYDSYTQARELIGPLEQEIQAWQLNEQARGEAIEVRDRVTALKDQAVDANAERWAADALTQAKAAWDKAAALLEDGKYAEAIDVLAEAETAYQTAVDEGKAGKAAGQAQVAVVQAMKASVSEDSLRKFAGEALARFIKSRSEGEVQLSSREYDKAKQSFEEALAALSEAEKLVELARYKKVFAYHAGYEASAIMLGAARGDGIAADDLKKLNDAYAKLRLSSNPASKVKSGDDIGFTTTMGPLVNEARDAITQTHGEAVQACYLIGFNASIIEQTLNTNALTDDQQKRIHQCLGVIEEAANKAGWDTVRFGPVIEQVRTANRNAKVNVKPESTRTAWQKLMSPMQDRETASRLMDPVASPSAPDDPELFPNAGT